MGVYSINESANTLFSIDLDSIEESTHELGLAGGYAIMAENEANYNKILKAIGIAEYNVLESTGAEMIYEATDIKGFFGKIKAFLHKILEKIAGLFKKFIRMIDQASMKDKEFVKKYKGELAKLSSKVKSQFEYDGWEFNNEHINNWKPEDKVELIKDIEAFKKTCLDLIDGDGEPSTEQMDKVNAYIAKHNEDDDSDYHDTLRALVLTGKTGAKIEEDEFANEITEYFYGSTEKDTLSNIDVQTQLTYIEGTEGIKKTATKTYKEFEKTINKYTKELDKIEAKVIAKKIPEKDTTVWSTCMRFVNTLSNDYKTNLNYANTVYSAQLKALKDRNSQARAICVKMLGFKPKNESAEFEPYFESGSFLDRVELK